MKEGKNSRRGFALGIAALNNPADAAHNAVVGAQVDQDHSLFSNDVAPQQSIFYWVTEPVLSTQPASALSKARSPRWMTL